jgi:UDP-N-acetyl-2-amino-2-deoxyglucuronate dehydrogenase
MMGDVTSLRAALVGCGNMGKRLVRILDGLRGYELVAGCDLAEPQVQAFTGEFTNARGYIDYARMLSEEEPHVVVVATNNVTHAMLTIQAAEAGVRGVYCEKPMASCLADGRAMVEACRRNGVALAVNHQRRLMPVFVTMRRLIEEGAIGQVELIRGGCAGDVLSDGTHTIDTIRHLAGDAEVKWVFGQIYRGPPDPDEPRAQGYHVSGGWRYGHPVEEAAMAVFEFETGLRAEIFTGKMQPRGRRYQDYEVFGTEGRLRRAGDQADPPLLIQREDESGGWQPAPVDGTDPKATIATSLEQFARMIREGADHPLSGASGLKDLEVVMAVYESARLRGRVELPLQQPRFPLEIMVEQGEM